METVLQFSGGKDSLACLYLLKPRWHEIMVLWLSTPAVLPGSGDLHGRHTADGAELP